MASKRFNDEKDLMGACAGQDLEAWAVFTERYSKLMRIAIKRQLDRHGLTHAAHDIEDILQDTLTSIWRDKRISSVNNAASLPYWLAMVARNSALSHLRKVRREIAPDPLPEIETEENVAVFSPLFPGGPSPSDELSRGETAKKIDDSIDGLPPNEKLIIKLHLLYGKKYHDIAQMLGLPKGTVSSCIRRGKEKLRDALKDFFIFFATILPFLASSIVGGQK